MSGWDRYISKDGKPEITKNDTGDEFIKRWESTYQEYQWDTPHIPKATMHLVLGQIPAVRDMKIYTSSARYQDGRIHVLWLQPSGTGKAGAINFVEDVCLRTICDKLSMRFETPEEFTDAAMIGSFEEIKRWNKDVRAQVTERVLVPGWLSPGKIDIFAMPECAVLFESKSQYKENMMTWFQLAMDPIGRNRITKKLAKGEPIHVNPACSFFLTSYVPPSLTQRTTERGFVQRMVTIINEIPVKSRVKNMLKAIDGIGASDNAVDGLKKEVAYLSYYMSELDGIYKGKKLKASTNVMKNLKAVVYHVQDMLEGLPRYQQEELAKFADRSLSHAIKLSYHHAVLRRDINVEIEDVSYAEEYLYPILKKVIHFFQDAFEANSAAAAKENREHHILKKSFEKLMKDGFGKQDWVFREPLIKELSKNMRKRRDYVRSQIKKWVESGILDSGELSGHVMYKFNDRQA